MGVDPLPWRQVFLIGPPRCGGTLLFEAIARGPGVVTTGGESHDLLENIATLHPRDRGWSSNRLTESAATREVIATLAARWQRVVREHHREDSSLDQATTFAEKTPKNSLRISFLAAAFPTAQFVYLHRDPVAVISSMLDGWRSQEFVTYPNLPGWKGRLRWSFLLVPGWRELIDLPLAEIVTRQWSTCMTILLEDLVGLDRSRWHVADFDRLIAQPATELQSLRRAFGISATGPEIHVLPPSRSVLSAPRPDKWRRNHLELAPYQHLASYAIALAADTQRSDGNREVIGPCG